MNNQSNTNLTYDRFDHHNDLLYSTDIAYADEKKN